MSEELKNSSRGLQGLEDIEPLPELPKEPATDYSKDSVEITDESVDFDDNSAQVNALKNNESTTSVFNSDGTSSAQFSENEDNSLSLKSSSKSFTQDSNNSKNLVLESADLDSSSFNNSDFSPIDPLLSSPRISTRVWCVVCGVLMLIVAFTLWFLAVRTPLGQSYEEIVIDGFGTRALPIWLELLLKPLRKSIVIISISVLIMACALVIAFIRKRWLLIGQCVAIVLLSLAFEPLKKVLPRQMLVNIESLARNSAPSGHTLLVASACAILACCVTRKLRAWVALVSAIFTCLVSYSLMAGRWHRPTDVIMSLLIVGAISSFILSLSRKSGMDIPESRKSSVSIQIIGTSMITFGAFACVYSMYLVWQILPGVELSARWAEKVSYLSVYCATAGISLLVFGVIMVLRQSSASPLSKLGLVGAPPTPPSALSKDKLEEQSAKDKLSQILA